MLLPKVGEEYRVRTGYPVDIVVLEVDPVVGSVLICLAEDGPQKRVSLGEWEQLVLRNAVERIAVRPEEETKMESWWELQLSRPVKSLESATVAVRYDDSRTDELVLNVDGEIVGSFGAYDTKCVLAAVARKYGIASVLPSLGGAQLRVVASGAVAEQPVSMLRVFVEADGSVRLLAVNRVLGELSSDDLCAFAVKSLTRIEALSRWFASRSGGRWGDGGPSCLVLTARDGRLEALLDGVVVASWSRGVTAAFAAVLASANEVGKEKDNES